VPLIRTLDLAEARNRVRGRSAGESARAPFREAIAHLAGDRVLELTPDAGESMRAMKLNVTRAAREVGHLVAYGVSEEGTLLVWLEQPKRRRGPRRGRAVASS
jgi:hypothetical protein